jgi:nucleoside phosphorylase
MLDYDRLSARILSALTGEILPDSSWHVPERNEQRIAIAVCDATGMTPERWDRLTKDERIPWLHKTLKALEKQPAPNAWIESDDLPVYRPELASESLANPSRPAHLADSSGCSQLISHLVECHHRLADLRARHDYIAITCALLRLEGAGGTVLYGQPFDRILTNRPFLDRLSVSHGEAFDVAFFPLADSIEVERIPAALAPVESITGEIHPLLRQLPKTVRERLQLPDSDNWWRIVFHLAWHFPRPFLKATRRRLLSKDGAHAGISDETCVQLHGMGSRSDLLPGLIYSEMAHDLCTCSEAAVTVILDVLEKHAQVGTPTRPEARALSAEQRRTFDQLRAEFEAGAQMPMSLECKVLKLANSFESPPATEWAGLEVGGCVERFLTLSKLNDQQEIVQIRGPATDWFCQVAERAGNALPRWIPDFPLLFDDPQRGFGGPRPVMNRDACKRWIGFVFATIKQHAPEALRVTWGTSMGPLSYGFATLDRNLCGVSVLAIDLARLTTAAAETAKQIRETCSPFTVPSMEEQGFQWAEEVPPPTPPENYTLGQLVENLRRFGEDYHLAEAQIREENTITAKHSRIQLGAHVSGARACLLAIPGFAELREWAWSQWDEEISFALGRRIVDALVERSNGSLSTDAAEGLSLTEAVARLSAPPGEDLEKDELHMSRNELPAPIDRETSQRVIDELENWKRVLYAPPAEKPTLQDHVELTSRIVAWRDRYAPHFDVNSLDEVRRILMRRATGEPTSEEELRTAGERAARACDRIKGWLQTSEDLLEVKTAGYKPSTEMSRIVFELNNPPNDSPAKPGEPIEVPNPLDEARRPWLPILKEHIGKVPELAGYLTEEKLRQWLWRKFKVPPTEDLYAEQLVALFEGEQTGQPAERPSQTSYNKPTGSRIEADLVLVTVNPYETRAVHDAFREATGTDGLPVSLGGRLYHKLGTLNDTTVYHAISEMGSGGPGAMQQAVDKAIRALNPGAVIAVGIAFGVNENDQSIGDILLSKQLRLYDLQRAGAEIVLRGDKPHASSQLINHFEGFSQIKWNGAKVRPGVILSGEKLIDNIDYRDQLLKLEVEAVGGEMEGAGLYVSSHDHKVDWIVIKAICDWADGKKRKNKTQRQKKAAKNAAAFLIQALQYAPLKFHK